MRRSKIYHKGKTRNHYEGQKQNLPEPRGLPPDPTNNQPLTFPKGNHHPFYLSTHPQTLWFHFVFLRCSLSESCSLALCPASFAPYYVCEIYPGSYMQLSVHFFSLMYSLQYKYTIRPSNLGAQWSSFQVLVILNGSVMNIL